MWELVAATFPVLILLPPANRVALALRGPSALRYYRRILECRDGLTEIASWLTGPVPDGATPSEQAQLIRAAVARHQHQGAAPFPTPAAVLAAPTGDGTIADTAALLAVADALQPGPVTEHATRPR
ncbi:DUF6545 domain-containing protein [Pseudonocardia sp. HH130630-07]|uniref:DUF6545 domain-containing protein n=1 Tax=Pseudonocardia sp. HH130630-07 TaxID=1690815 RepID=UPI000814EABD|nr:DUF6545 domain-containing protein [Pseudonocardia sp. HH130630-07]ANY10698.1 hypothetical protein AFB00_30290 [Pseudonocardia sp. HH130630-07]